MVNPLVDAAVKGLSLVGIDVPPSAEGFIELLINAGEDALTVVPHIISVIEQLGAETWSTLEQLVEGMEQYGPTGYIQRQIDQAFSPHVDTIKYTNQQKQIMLENHRTTLANFHIQTQTLFTGPQAFNGPAATQTQMRLDFLLSGTSAHLDLLEQSLAVDQKFFTDYQSAIETAADAEIIILIIVGIILIIALVSVALTGGASLALIGGMAVGISAAEAWLLAGIIGCFVAWGIGHELLAHPVSINWPMSSSTMTTTSSTSVTTSHPMSITVIAGGASQGGQTVVTNGDGEGTDAQGWLPADQLDWAWDGAKACATSRATYIRQTGNGNINYAIGFLQENFYPVETYGPILGQGGQSTHSEQLIVNYWYKVRIPQLRSTLKPGSHLILLIFTRNVMCSGCNSMIPTWIQQLAAAAGPGASIHFYLWQSIDPTTPVGPGNLKLVPGA